MLGFGEKYNVEVSLLEWEYQDYFPSLQKFTGAKPGKLINEPAYHYTPDFFDSLDWSKDMDFAGYFQSEKYFPSDTKKLFAFHPCLVNRCILEFSEVFKKETIAIHVRRGDYVGNPNYVNLTPVYYLLALEEHFPGWREMNLLFFSDDINYCKLHFQCLPNAYFSEGLTDIADLCSMSLCDNFIIANSSFSWWAAFLGQRKKTKIVRPVHHFVGKLKDLSIRDLYPESWIAFDHIGGKIDLKDVTFTIPVSYDHEDRKENLELCVAYLLTQFNTNVVIGEQGGKHFQHLSEYCEYRHFDLDVFHRTKMLNDMAQDATTPYVANYDCDVFLTPCQILQAVERLKNDVDVCYPYAGNFVHVERNEGYWKLSKDFDLESVASMKSRVTRDSKGGAVFVNNESFFKAGGENENMVNHAPEDLERWERFNKLGLKVERIKGDIWHMEHWRGANSRTDGHKHSTQNRKEYEKIKAMNADQLKNYVATWKK